MGKFTTAAKNKSKKNKKKLIIPRLSGLSILVIICAALTITSAYFLLKSSMLQSRVSQVEPGVSQLRSSDQNLEKAIQENRRLKEAIAAHEELALQMQTEKAWLQTQLKEFREIVKDMDKRMFALNSQLEDLREKLARKQNPKDSKEARLLKENEELKQTVSLMEEALKELRVTYYSNLGVAYTHAQLFDEAMKHYAKTLIVDPDQPDAHYNLGLLYENYKKDAEKAIFHYRRYLELKPSATDWKEVQAQIDNLSLRLVK